MAIIDGQRSEPPVWIEFDVKLESMFQVINALEVTVNQTDQMKANFNKKMTSIFGEILKYAITESSGEDYAWPKVQTKDISEHENYLPQEKDFKYGGRLFTNKIDQIRIHKSKWSLPVALYCIRRYEDNPDWEFQPQYLYRHWLFGSRDVVSNKSLKQ